MNLRHQQVALVAILLFFGFVFVHETVARIGGHQPSVQSDRDLWSLVREKVKAGDSSRRQILLLGASRMQTGIDTEVLCRELGYDEVLMLAISGRNTSKAVLRDIANATDFRGLIIASETEATLAAKDSGQQAFVDYFHNTFNLERRLNRKMRLVFEQNLACGTPGCDSLRLWGGLIFRQRIETPLPTLTNAQRCQSIRFEDYKFTMLADLWKQRTIADEQAETFSKNDRQIWIGDVREGWKSAINHLKSRDATVVMLRMPVPPERWSNDQRHWPVQDYWDTAMNDLGVVGIHFAEHPSLMGFNSPDASHLAAKDKAAFTRALAEILRNEVLR